ncbi:MAG TPA: methionine synthase [Frankiaceae bacterium]|nr:methionine synthase [Frankiaceae bacterium]
MSGLPWPPGAATGVGSLPGTDPREAARLVLGELPALPHLPELPARGPWAGLAGRGAALLTGLHVDLQPAGFRLVARPGVDQRRARDLLERDLDALEEVAAGYAGPLKVQAAGPWTLAAALELPRGNKALADPGAVRDLTGLLAEGLAAHVADVRRRVPGARVLVQVDEPSLPAVLAGRVPTASGFGALPAVEEPVAQERLRVVLAVAGVPAGVHCCAPSPPVGLAHRAGAAFVGVDATRLAAPDDDALGEAVEGGLGLLLGVAPATERDATGRKLSDPRRTVEPVRSLWRRLGLAAERAAEVVVVTPTCGLAGASPAHARAALRRCGEAARVLLEEPR